MTGPATGDAWQRVADASRDAMVLLDRDLRVVVLNAAALHAADMPADALVGHDIFEVFPDARGTDREAAIRGALATGQGSTLRQWNAWMQTWVDVDVIPDPAGVLVAVRDVAGLVELERRERIEGAILSSVAEGIYGIDQQHRVTFANAAALRLLGYAESELIGSDAHELLHHTRADGSPYPLSHCPLLRTLDDGQSRDSTGDVLWRADGTPLPVEYHSAAIEQNGDTVGAVVSFRDLTDRLEAEQAQLEVEHAQLAAAAAVGALHELQQVLQPPPPLTDDPILGVFYLPADAAGAGGDLYDWQALPHDGMHLAVVDVVGKGLVAARDALAVTHALRLLVLADTPLDQVARQASWLLADAYPDLAASALIGHYERGTGQLRLVSAGHPPALLIHPDGTHQYLDASGRPLGWPDAGTDDMVELVVPPGGRVVMYTDGLIEGSRDILGGMETLAELAVSTRHLDAADAARHLVTEILNTAQRRDDCLALVLDRPAR